MENKINYGNVFGIPIFSILVEDMIAKVEKQTYTTTQSTTSTNTTTQSIFESSANHSYYDVKQNVNVTTNTHSIPHFITRLYLTNGVVLTYNYNVDVMEGWHIRQHLLYINNQEKIIFTFIPESGKYIDDKYDVEKIIMPYFLLKQPNFWSEHTNYKKSILLSIPCLLYLLQIAFPKFFDFELNWFIKGISLCAWGALSVFLTIFEMVLNKKRFYAALISYNNAVAEVNAKSQQLHAELDPVIQQVKNINQTFNRFGFQEIQ